MSDAVNFIMKVETPWRVGYATRTDEFFIFKFDSDDICWALSRHGMTVGAAELLIDDSYIDLGEL